MNINDPRLLEKFLLSERVCVLSHSDNRGSTVLCTGSINYFFRNLQAAVLDNYRSNIKDQNFMISQPTTNSHHSKVKSYVVNCTH